MSPLNKVNYLDLMEDVKKVKKPFSRENFTSNLKPEFGVGTFAWYDSGSGIATSTTNLKFTKDTIATLSSNVAGAVLIFNLENETTHFYKDGKSYTVKKDEYYLGFSSNNFAVDIMFKKDKHYCTLNVGIKEALFLELTHNLVNLNEKMKEANKKGYSILTGGKVDPEQNEILKFFKNKDLNEFLLTDLHLESKTINLIEYTIKKIVSNINATYNIDKTIINSLEKAKELITNSYYENLTIKEIAYKSAINECYLKKDFKRYFGMTVYEMLQKRRLDVAKKLLQEEFSVKEVCSKVGYKHVGNFSKIFQEHFNITPSKYKKQFS